MNLRPTICGLRAVGEGLGSGTICASSSSVTYGRDRCFLVSQGISKARQEFHDV